MPGVYGSVVESVDTTDLKSVGIVSRGGSNPPAPISIYVNTFSILWSDAHVPLFELSTDPRHKVPDLVL